jgi:1,4-alpha-glucan branching enzyme
MPLPAGRFANPYQRAHAAMKKPVTFICHAPEASSVYLSGDFNDWHPTALPMKRQADGAWHVVAQLEHGHHHYWFLVDGKPVLDPRAMGVARTEQNERCSLIAVS